MTISTDQYLYNITEIDFQLSKDLAEEDRGLTDLTIKLKDSNSNRIDLYFMNCMDQKEIFEIKGLGSLIKFIDTQEKKSIANAE